MTWDGVASRWFAHAAMPIELAELFVGALQPLLLDAYDFALVHAVTNF